MRSSVSSAIACETSKKKTIRYKTQATHENWATHENDELC